jgi:5'-nucleotidase
MMRPMVLAVDVDGVIADMFPVWLERYQRDYPAMPYELADVYGERAKQDSVLLSYLNDPTLYQDVKPIHGAIAGVQQLRAMGHRVVFVTSCVKGMIDGKWDWLQKYGFLPEGKFQASDLIVIHDKTLVRADVLVDDLPKNVEAWGGRGVLFQQPWNLDSRHMPRASGWSEVIQILQIITKVLTA